MAQRPDGNAMINVVLSDVERDAIKRLAAREGLTVSSLCRLVLARVARTEGLLTASPLVRDATYQRVYGRQSRCGRAILRDRTDA